MPRMLLGSHDGTASGAGLMRGNGAVSYLLQRARDFQAAPDSLDGTPRLLEIYVAAPRLCPLSGCLFHWQPAARALEYLPVRPTAVTAVAKHIGDANILFLITARLSHAEAAQRSARDDATLMCQAGRLHAVLELAAQEQALHVSTHAGHDEVLADLFALDADELVLAAIRIGDRPLGPVVLPEGAPAPRPTSTVGLDDLAVFAGPLPGVATLRAAERVLRASLRVEVPAELIAIPRELWRPARHLSHLRRAGLDVRWARSPRHPDEPRLHSFRVWIGERGGSGHEVRDPALALQKAISEAVERFVWATYEPRVVRTAGRRTLEEPTIDLDAIAGYRAALRAREPARFAWNDDTVFRWVPGTSLTSGEERWLPAQLLTRRQDDEPALRPHVTTGVAAHPDRETAIKTALLEVIERDAFMLTWLTSEVPTPLDLTAVADDEIAELLRRFEAADFVAYAALLPTDVGIPVVLAAVEDRSGIGPEGAIGLAAHEVPIVGARKALIEAFVTWRWLRQLRAAGRAAPSEPADLTLETRALWWASAQRFQQLGWLWGAGAQAAAPGLEPHLFGVDPQRFGSPELAARLQDVGEDAIVVDLTDDAMTVRLGLHVVCVVAPGFHPLHLQEAYPALWSRRLERRLLSRPVNPAPHPFA